MTVAILGIGLMGGSLGMALRTRMVAHVVGWARRQETASLAMKVGAINHAAATVAEAVREADIVVLCVPVDAIAALARDIAPHLKSDAVVTDVGSAKARLVADSEILLGGRFVGGHPMAGSEESGLASASPDLYVGASWVLTPTDCTAPTALESVERLAESVGAVPRRCAPDLHDRLVASVSHLPHLLAYGLAQTAGERVPEDWTDLPAGSFRDGARVARSDPALWTGILLDNRTAALEAFDGFLAWANEVRDRLDRNDALGLGELLQRAHNVRKRFK